MPEYERMLVQVLLFSLLAACLWVLAPFWTSLFWAAVLAFASWPLMPLLTRLLNGRDVLAAGLLTAGWMLLVALPLLWLLANLASHMREVLDLIQSLQVDGLPSAPLWMGSIPLIGGWLAQTWQTVSEQGAAILLGLRPYLGEMGNWLLASSAQIGGGLIQLVLSLVLVFFFYRDGPRLAMLFEKALQRLIGSRALHYRLLIAGTVQRVVNGVIGTAAAQALLALIGFSIVGVPGAVLLSVLTFAFSLIPMGPPLIWGPVTAWLVWRGDFALAIFLLAWGTVVISGVDNILKPYLISRGGTLPLVIVLLGVFGGLLAFGFMGLFLGPTLLAVAYSLIGDWLDQKPDAATEQTGPPS
jgi:predicted PurR-regulated permease PerM